MIIHDYNWVEVTRMNVYPTFEGLGYGCWFSHTPESGMWINVGKVLNIGNRYEATQYFCESFGSCFDHRDTIENLYEYASSETICKTYGCPCDVCDPHIDSWWVIRAHLAGFDSFTHRHEVRYYGNITTSTTGFANSFSTGGLEITITTKSCLLQHSAIHACAPIPLMVGIGQPNKACTRCGCIWGREFPPLHQTQLMHCLETTTFSNKSLVKAFLNNDYNYLNYLPSKPPPASPLQLQPPITAPSTVPYTAPSLSPKLLALMVLLCILVIFMLSFFVYIALAMCFSDNNNYGKFQKD